MSTDATAPVPERWTRATVYDDMWVDPADDPRGTDGVSPDGERATLADYLASYRITLTMKCDGLEAEALATRSVPPSTMSLLGLVRHLAEVEHSWGCVLSGEPRVALYGPGDADFDGAVADAEVVSSAFADLTRERGRFDDALAERPDLGERRPHGDGPGVAVREVVIHLIEEYARHCGHADLLRERIDGRVGQ